MKAQDLYTENCNTSLKEKYDLSKLKYDKWQGR